MDDTNPKSSTAAEQAALIKQAIAQGPITEAYQADGDRPLDRCQSAAATGSKLIFSRVPVALAKRSSVRVEGRT
jgi:hypothetical protein